MLCSTKVFAREVCGLVNAREHQCLIRADTLARGFRLVVDLLSETWLTPASDRDAGICRGGSEWPHPCSPFSFSLWDELVSSAELIVPL
jgi:hypothetical protein